MTIELCSENSSVTMSPRISFSYGFCQSDIIPVEPHDHRSDSNASEFESCIDFDFCVRESFDHDSSSADELFSDGKILPIQIKNTACLPEEMDHKLKSQPPLPPPQRRRPLRDHIGSKCGISKSESAKESKSLINDTEEKQNSKSFWSFKRSSSLNCVGGGYGRSLCPLPLLSRSNSTGSEASTKRSQLSKDNHSHKQQKHSQIKPSQSSSSSMSNHKPPFKKVYGSQSNSSVRISPVLNMAPPSLFGLGSLFNGKDKGKKK
ncbi:uncharacterized protein LOC131158328 [Malania oleifera]|uniref:uncharacterized protein LOC131158328 n=1 Tax=Malania oleifera TaxID=397392 RepID=UPI0025ADBDDC|nr:uncharacterized protein LOC131158328 [Malania oleifera]